MLEHRQFHTNSANHERRTALPLAGMQISARPFHVVFDVSDVINYFRSARLPTGIQRVQIEIVEFAIRDAGFDFSIACFTKEANYWIEIPRDLFATLAQLSVSDFADSAWDALALRLEIAITTGAPFKFSYGSVLLNLGSSWWLQNYFLGVRYAKTRFAIRYVPFIHDLIPMAMPELCVAELRNNFEEWIESVFAHADYFLVNSKNTLADLRVAAREAGAEREAAVVRLDADFRDAPTSAEHSSGDDLAQVLRELGLEHERFVLFVSTIEPRKNHSMVFAAWLKLLRRHGARNCPKLVCVGQRGWLNDKAHARLASSDELKRQVVILSNISDVVLSRLYEACICTLYPSLYEGWGLPVTESLCFGKVPIVSRVASLLEAGSTFAEYFDANSERDFLEAVERIVFDPSIRTQRERKIKAEFRPRSWPEIGAQIVRQLQRWTEDAPAHVTRIGHGDSVHPVPIKTGAFYSLAGEVQNARGHTALRGEMYRNGGGWWWPEPWGCWTRERGPATLAFVVPDSANAKICVRLGVRGVQGLNGTAIIHTSERQRIAVVLQGDEERIVEIALEQRPEHERLVVLNFVSDSVADFRPPTQGRDFRVCGIGIKWFFVCREDDLVARMQFIETLQTENAKWIGVKREVEECRGPSVTKFRRRDLHKFRAIWQTATRIAKEAGCECLDQR